MTRTYRPGALGAMMDEYERAAVELKALNSSGRRIVVALRSRSVMTQILVWSFR